MTTSHKSISIFELRPGLCACVVPEPGVRYCGAPVTNFRFRMCETHASAYLTYAVRKTDIRPSHKGLK